MAAPKGNQFARKAKDWERSLRRALENYENKEEGVDRGQALYHAAQRVVRAAVAGDWDAIEHIACRLDGKPTERVEIDATHKHFNELTPAEIDERIARITERIAELAAGAEAPGVGSEEPAPVH
jgi:hypothetical protein